MSAQQPLVTTFTPAASCTADIYTNTGGTYYSIGGPTPSQCFPSGWLSTSQYFSPGLCPNGYGQACSSIVSTGTVTETQVTCCPAGYICYTPTLVNFLGQACVSTFISQTTTVVTDASALTTLIATLHSSTEAVNGYGVSIRYQSSDFATTSTSPSMPTSPLTSGASSAPTTPPSSGLSTGAKAGIGAAIGAAALIAVIGLAIFFVSRRQRYVGVQQENPAKETDGVQGTPVELGASSIPKTKVYEVYTLPAELVGDDTRN